MVYDIFISYRRDGGEYTAKILRDHLQDAGYRTFFDVESLRSGNFNTKLYSVIDECTDFLLVLSPGALDRCKNEDDWVRREVEYALEKGKNVIPVMLRGFSFPDTLPPSLEPLRYRNGLEANSQFFDAFLQQLKGKFLQTKPPVWRRVSQSSILHRSLPLLLALTLLLAGGFVIKTLIDNRNTRYPSTNAEKNLTNELIYYTSCNLTNLDLMGRALDDAIQASQRYLSSAAGNYDDLQDRFSVCRQALDQINLEFGAPAAGLLERLSDSPFEVDDAEAMYSGTANFLSECLGHLDYITWIVSPDCRLSNEEKLETLSCYQAILNESLQSYAYCTNDLLLPITDHEALDEFWYKICPEFVVLPLQASNWEEDKAVLESSVDQCYNRMEQALMDLTAMVGSTNLDNIKLEAENAKMQEELVLRYMEQGYTRKEAEELVELISQLRESCLPKPEDSVNDLWNKMTHLLSCNLYEDALDCVAAYESLIGNDEYALRYLPALRAFIDLCRNQGLLYGVMVMEYVEEDGIHELLEIGDVILTLNGEFCFSTEGYLAKKEQCAQNVFHVQLLRMNDSGGMDLVSLELSKDMPRVYLNTVVYPPDM